MVRKSCTCLFFSVLLAALHGCDRGPERYAVSGHITFQKQALKNGIITFYPIDTGTQGGATITDGKYQIPQEQGLSPGKYRVSISSPDGATPVDPNAAPGPSGNFASKERIPPEFERDSKITIEVTASGPNTFDFTIP
ncbi:MAG: hypothetical protein FJ303_23285 [Planctomycetes bacterium]|nr:hypothetical protein [Planctomycetota bacterium]